MVENQEEWSGFRMGREKQLELAEWEEVMPKRWRRRMREWGLGR